MRTILLAIFLIFCSMAAFAQQHMVPDGAGGWIIQNGNPYTINPGVVGGASAGIMQGMQLLEQQERINQMRQQQQIIQGQQQQQQSQQQIQQQLQQQQIENQKLQNEILRLKLEQDKAASQPTQQNPQLDVTKNPDFGNWKAIYELSSGTYYVNPSLIQKKGNKIKMWALLNNKMPASVDNGNPILSAKFLYFFDCKEEQVMMLSGIAFSENMGKGYVIKEEDKISDTWHKLPPDSAGTFMMKFACGYKVAQHH